MRLTPRGSTLPPSDDLATALATAAEHLGHRPAITVVRRDRRDEQGFLSLAGWAAKGAHLLQIEAELGPGDRVRLVAPAGWPAAAVCCAAWWAGIVVTTADDARVTVQHESTPVAVHGDVYAIGDAVDGSPGIDGVGEPWALAVQSFPDRPPPPGAQPDTLALEVDGTTWTHRDLIAFARGAASAVAADAQASLWIPALARALVTGEPLTIT